MVDSDQTPEPGTRVVDAEARDVIATFRSAFRNEISGYPAEVPTACTLEGEIFDSIKEVPGFTGSLKTFVLFEPSLELYLAQLDEVAAYQEHRNPWEDYDFCVFDIGFSWCVGVSHNRTTTLVGALPTR